MSNDTDDQEFVPQRDPRQETGMSRLLARHREWMQDSGGRRKTRKTMAIPKIAMPEMPPPPPPKAAGQDPYRQDYPQPLNQQPQPQGHPPQGYQQQGYQQLPGYQQPASPPPEQPQPPQEPPRQDKYSNRPNRNATPTMVMGPDERPKGGRRKTKVQMSLPMADSLLQQSPQTPQPPAQQPPQPPAQSPQYQTQPPQGQQYGQPPYQQQQSYPSQQYSAQVPQQQQYPAQQPTILPPQLSAPRAPGTKKPRMTRNTLDMTLPLVDVGEMLQPNPGAGSEPVAKPPLGEPTVLIPQSRYYGPDEEGRLPPPLPPGVRRPTTPMQRLVRYHQAYSYPEGTQPKAKPTEESQGHAPLMPPGFKRARKHEEGQLDRPRAPESAPQQPPPASPEAQSQVGVWKPMNRVKPSVPPPPKMKILPPSELMKAQQSHSQQPQEQSGSGNMQWPPVEQATPSPPVSQPAAPPQAPQATGKGRKTRSSKMMKLPNFDEIAAAQPKESAPPVEPRITQPARRPLQEAPPGSWPQQQPAPPSAPQRQFPKEQPSQQFPQERAFPQEQPTQPFPQEQPTQPFTQERAFPQEQPTQPFPQEQPTQPFTQERAFPQEQPTQPFPQEQPTQPFTQERAFPQEEQPTQQFPQERAFVQEQPTQQFPQERSFPQEQPTQQFPQQQATQHIPEKSWLQAPQQSASEHPWAQPTAHQPPPEAQWTQKTPQPDERQWPQEPSTGGRSWPQESSTNERTWPQESSDTPQESTVVQSAAPQPAAQPAPQIQPESQQPPAQAQNNDSWNAKASQEMEIVWSMDSGSYPTAQAPDDDFWSSKMDSEPSAQAVPPQPAMPPHVEPSPLAAQETRSFPPEQEPPRQAKRKTTKSMKKPAGSDLPAPIPAPAPTPAPMPAPAPPTTPADPWAALRPAQRAQEPLAPPPLTSGPPPLFTSQNESTPFPPVQNPEKKQRKTRVTTSAKRPAQTDQEPVKPPQFPQPSAQPPQPPMSHSVPPQPQPPAPAQSLPPAPPQQTASGNWIAAQNQPLPPVPPDVAQKYTNSPEWQPRPPKVKPQPASDNPLLERRKGNDPTYAGPERRQEPVEQVDENSSLKGGFKSIRRPPTKELIVGGKQKKMNEQPRMRKLTRERKQLKEDVLKQGLERFKDRPGNYWVDSGV